MCMYDWTGVRSTSTKSYLSSAPLWEKTGVQAYDDIIRKGFVFQLDQVERTGDQAFRDFQLRARDGELGPDDWTYLASQMDASKRPSDFSGPQVLLTCTRSCFAIFSYHYHVKL